MKLFILGGSGGVGRHLLTLARERGHDVTALVRPSSPPAAAPAAAGALCVITGEVLGNRETLDAMTGHDAVLSSLGMKRKTPANPWSALVSSADFCSRSATQIVEAMKRNRVQRVIAVSAAGVGDSAPAMNLGMKLLVRTSSIGVAYRNLAVMEGVFRDASASGSIDWLCPRPTRLTRGPLTHKARVTESFPSSAAISRADVAAWMLDALAVADWGAAWPTRTPQITA
jgi:putative NADH-flavin reductase